HADPEGDVAIIDIGDLLHENIKTDRQTEKLMVWSSVGPEDFSGQNKISVDVADDVLIIGYPRGFYDHVNLYPIVKGGIVASRWGAHFSGKPYFLIDAKLFPGSSGSIVVSKPRDFVMDGGQIFYANEKQFAFLGVFSGEFRRQGAKVELDDLIIVQKSGYDVGIVWYADLVEEIIDKGLPLSSSEATATQADG
ncbi:MAG: serine protease, partial [Chloroflexi bacterium]|nr:serine protease [Chloroflexota bacterium]